MFLMRPFNELHLYLKLHMKWNPDVCRIQQCTSPWTFCECFVRSLWLFIIHIQDKRTFKMNNKLRMIALQSSLNVSSHMVCLNSLEWIFYKLQEEPPVQYALSISISNIGLRSETKWSVSLLDICHTQWLIACIYKRWGLTLMKRVYPGCFRPTLTFSCLFDRLLLVSCQDGQDFMMSLNVSIGLLKDLIWSL